MKNILFGFYGTFILIFPPLSFFAQVPNLGTAANFAIFTSTGAVGDRGQSNITGNIGTDSGEITGFGPINGFMYSENAFTSMAAKDLWIAYNVLNNAKPGYFIGPLIGNGDTLKAGVYSIKGGGKLNGNLYLDAKGDPNALFIMQMSAGFSSGANAKVILMNGAQTFNVFWKVDGKVMMGPGTFMKGIIVANNGDINFSLNDTLEGKAFSTTGAVNLNKVVVFGDDLNIPTVPLDDGLWILLGLGVVYAGIRFKKLRKIQSCE